MKILFNPTPTTLIIPIASLAPTRALDDRSFRPRCCRAARWRRRRRRLVLSPSRGSRRRRCGRRPRRCAWCGAWRRSGGCGWWRSRSSGSSPTCSRATPSCSARSSPRPRSAPTATSPPSPPSPTSSSPTTSRSGRPPLPRPDDDRLAQVMLNSGVRRCARCTCPCFETRGGRRWPLMASRPRPSMSGAR